MTNKEIIAIIGIIIAFLTAFTGIINLWWRIKEIRLALKDFNLKNTTPDQRIIDWINDLPSPKEFTEKFNIDLGNPYVIGIPIIKPDLFYGRKDILQSVISYAYGEQMKSTGIMGARGSGKTSFLNFLEYSILSQRSKIIPVYLDARTQLSSPENFYAYMLREIIKTLERRNKNTPSSPNVDKEISFDTLKNSIEQLSSKNWRFFILLDDLSKMTNNSEMFDEKFFSALRSLILNGNIGYVISDYESIDQPETYTSPFANIFQGHHYLGPLSEQDAVLLVKEPASRFGHQFENEDIDFIIKMAGKMPYNIQKASSLLYDLQKKGLIGEEGRKQMKNEFSTSMENRFTKQLNQLKVEEKDSLVKVSKNLSTTCFLRSLVNLENYGFIEKVDGQYKVLGETLAEYLSTLQSTD